MKKLQDIPNLPEAFIAANKAYCYQPQLTEKLDKHAHDFSEITLLEIVLWKTNRYPTITQDLLEDINELRNSYNEQKARNLLSKLLKLRGFDLPMASTVLRFALPDKLQIIDQRVYRFIMPNEDYLKIPYNIELKIELYFTYLRELKKICSMYQIPFANADRVIYQMDKTYNKSIPLKTSS